MLTATSETLDAQLTTLLQLKRARSVRLTVERIRNKEIVVGVIGLGYVGLALALAFAESDLQVVGFDIDAHKVSQIREGQSYIHHLSSERIQQVREKRCLLATEELRYAGICDVLLICLPTPLTHNLEPDLRYIETTCRELAHHLQPDTLLSLESTTWPGTTDEVVKPLLEANPQLKVGETLFLCYSPEREDPGNTHYHTRTIPKLVGASDPHSLDLAKAFYSLLVEKIVPLSTMRAAEATKLFENIFRSVNIALVNELKVILDAMGIDVWEVLKAAQTKPFGFLSFWPGPGPGGHCIPVDPFYLTWKAKEFGMHTRFIELAGEINRSMPRWVVGKIQDCLNDRGQALKGSQILVLGLAYKPDVDDMRESPSLEIMRLLEAKGAEVDYHDPFLPVIGPSRDYSCFEGRQSQPLSPAYDCFVISTHHSCFDPATILSFGVPVVDTRNILPKHPLVTSA